MYAKEDIRDYIRANWKYFADGLGLRSPSWAIKHYSENPDQWADDLVAIDHLRHQEAAQQQEEMKEASKHKSATASSGMSGETASLLQQIKDLHDDGHSPQAIADLLDLCNTKGVYAVLKLKPETAEDVEAIEPQDPRIRGFVNGFKKL